MPPDVSMMSCMKNNQLYWHRTYASLFIIVSFLSIVLFGWADATAGPTGSEKSEEETDSDESSSSTDDDSSEEDGESSESNSENEY